MNRNVLQVKMSGDRLQELYRLYDSLWANYKPEGAHELLLHGHIIELWDRLEKMADKEQATYTLSFSRTEALAFVQLWEDGGMGSIQTNHTVIIQSIFDVLDKRKKMIAWKR